MFASLRKATTLLTVMTFALITLSAAIPVGNEAWAQGKGKGNGNASQGGSKGKNKGSGKQASSGGSGGSNSKASGNKSSSRNTVTAGKTQKVANLNSQLKSLNSLKRNPEALLNSSDKKLAELQGFLALKSDLESSLAEQDLILSALQSLDAELGAVSAALTEAELAQTAIDEALIENGAAITDLAAQIALLDPALDQEQIDVLSNQLQELETTGSSLVLESEQAAGLVNSLSSQVDGFVEQQGQTEADLGLLVAEIESLEEATGEDDLVDALVSFLANSGQTATTDSITPEMLDWAKEQLGL